MVKVFDATVVDYIQLSRLGARTSVNLFHGDYDTTGIYYGQDLMGIAIGGADSIKFESSGVSLYKPLVSTDSVTCAGITSLTQSYNGNYFAAAIAAVSQNILSANYFATPIITGSFIPSQASTVHIEGPPTSGSTKYSLYVASGDVYFAAAAKTATLSIGNSLISSAAIVSRSYTVPDAGGSASFILSLSKAGQTIAAGNITGSTVNGANLQLGTSTMINNTASNTVHMNYIYAPTITGTQPSLAVNLCIAGAPSGAASAYSLMVNSGTSYFGGNIIAPSMGFVGDITTGISGGGSGNTLINSSGTQILSVGSGGISLSSGKKIDFSGALAMTLGGIPHLSMDSTGLHTLANGYAGSVSASVSVVGMPSGASTFGSGTLQLYMFPMGGKTYYVYITTGTDATFLAQSAPANSNYMKITFSGITLVSAFLHGAAGTRYTGTSTSQKNIVLCGFSSGNSVASNSITMNFPINSTLLSGLVWNSGAALSVYVSGIIVADK